MSFPSGPCKHITWLKARVAMPWPSSCIGNEAGVAEFQPIEREFLRASTTSSRAFHARYTRRLGIPTTEFLKPRSQCTKLAVVCTNDVTVTSRSFVRWPEQRYTRAGGSVDFVREIVFPCPEETFSRPAAIRCATTIPVVLTRCSLLDRERTNFLSLRTPIDRISEASMQNLYLRDRTIIIVQDAESLGSLSSCAIIPFPLLRIIVSLET